MCENDLNNLVLFSTVIPQVKVTNQLVGAPLGSDVQLQCYIEASPKAMNSWYREDGKCNYSMLLNFTYLENQET